MLDLITLGHRIAELRESRGLTQEDVAEKLGVGRTAVSRLENGQRDISYAEILKLSEILEVKPEEIAQIDRYQEKLTFFRQTTPEQATENFEKVNEIIDILLGFDSLYRRFGLEKEQ